MTTHQPDPPHITSKIQNIVNHQPHPLLFASICGSKLYGFDTPHSDRDVHGAHILPLNNLLGLAQPNPVSIVSKYPDPPPVEISTHDVRKCFSLLLNRNANVLEHVISPLTAATTPEHTELQAIAQASITSRHSRHYTGMANQAMNLLVNKPNPKVKHALHIYRALLTGIHLMRTGRLQPHLPTLNQEFQLPAVDRLLQQRQDPAAPQTVTPQEKQASLQEARRLATELELAAGRSHLPQELNGKPALNNLLLRIRKQAR